MKKEKLLLIGLLILIVVGVVYRVSFLQREPVYNVPIKVGDRELMVEIVDTPALRERGLSGRKELLDGNGMLFVFPEPTIPRFWMPNMNFPLDMIFIRDHTVVYIEHSVPNFPPGTPLDQLPTYSPPEPVDMILEVPAGWAERNGVSVGVAVSISSR